MMKMKTTLAIVMYFGSYLQTVRSDVDSACEISDMRALMVAVIQLRSELHEYKEKTLMLEKELQDLKVDTTTLKTQTASLNKTINTTAAKADDMKSVILGRVSDLNISLYELSYSSRAQAKEIKELNETVQSTASELNGSIYELGYEIKFYASGVNSTFQARMSKMFQVLENHEEDMQKSIENLNNTALTLADELKGTIMTLSSDTDERIVKLYATLQNQTFELEKLKNMNAILTSPAVGFVSKSVTDHFICNGTVSFPNTVLNYGNAFNSSNGYFTAPYSAMYMFSVQMCLHSDTIAKYKIRSSTTVFSQTYYRETHDDSCSSVTTIGYLLKGDLVFVDCTSSNFIEGTSESFYWTMFSGALLQ